MPQPRVQFTFILVMLQDVGPGDDQRRPVWVQGLCTVERFDLPMVVKMSALGLSASEGQVFIKPMLEERKPEL